MDKNFNNELDKFYNHINDMKPIAITRYGDGEMMIINNEFIDLQNKANGEFIYDPNNPSDSLYRDNLIESYTYQDSNYFVGIACPCCVGDTKYQNMKQASGQPEDNLTWANIFVNSNYNKFLSDWVYGLFKELNTVLVCNTKSNVENLPFLPNAVYYVGQNAWKNDYDLIHTLKRYISKNDKKKTLFLFAAGPFSNILVYELYKYRKNNMYVNIGSTLDVILGLGRTRGYLNGNSNLSKVCIW